MGLISFVKSSGRKLGMFGGQGAEAAEQDGDLTPDDPVEVAELESVLESLRVQGQWTEPVSHPTNSGSSPAKPGKPASS